MERQRVKIVVTVVLTAWIDDSARWDGEYASYPTPTLVVRMNHQICASNMWFVVLTTMAVERPWCCLPRRTREDMRKLARSRLQDLSHVRTLK